MLISIKSGNTEGNAFTLNFLAFTTNLPPARTPTELPTNLTGIPISTALLSLISKKSACKIESFTGWKLMS